MDSGRLVVSGPSTCCCITCILSEFSFLVCYICVEISVIAAWFREHARRAPPGWISWWRHCQITSNKLGGSPTFVRLCPRFKRTAVRTHAYPCKLYITVVFAINTQLSTGGFTHRSDECYCLTTASNSQATAYSVHKLLDGDLYEASLSHRTLDCNLHEYVTAMSQTRHI